MYRMDEKMDKTPHRPLSSVIRSARCSARMRLKCPVSSLRRVVCLSTMGLSLSLLSAAGVGG